MSSGSGEAQLGEPVYLDAEPGGVLAFLHLPAEASKRETAVLFCPPFGWEEACSYRGLRTWAATLANDGYPTVRLTLPSLGDSAGAPRDPQRLAAWSAAVAAAAAWLRGRTTVARVAAIGIGVGGAAALQAISEGAGIDEVVLWSVPNSGRRLVRQMQIHANMVAAEFPEDASAATEPDGDLELIGYVLSADTARELGQLRVDQLSFSGGRPRRALLLGRDGLGVDARLQAHLEHGGTEVTAADGPDYATLMANPQQSLAPQHTVALTRRWLAESEGAVVEQPSAGPADSTTTMRLRHGDIELEETPLRVPGPRGRMFGVLCEPASATRADLCVVLLNAGALPHTGPNRSWVELARRWASRGVSSLRIDLAGVGEADGDDPSLLSDPSLYADWRDAEVTAILDELDGRDVADRFVLAGLCSGAYRAVRLAQTDSRVAGALLINLYAFQWSEELVSERGRRRELAGGLPNVRAQPFGRALVAKALHYSRPDRAWRILRGPAERAQKGHAVRALDALRERGVETLLLMAQNEPLYDQLARQGLLDELHRWPNVTLQRFPSRDHMFRALRLQCEVHAALDQALERIRATASRAPAAPARR